MKRILFSLICMFLLALPSNAKVFIPLVKNVPPSTSSGGEARVGIRTYPPLAYYDDNYLFIQFPYKTTSNVIISDNGLYVKYDNLENVSFVKIDLRSIDKSFLYKLYINEYDKISVNQYRNTWVGYLDLRNILFREQTIKLFEEQSITLRIGESRKLSLDPADTKYHWRQDLNHAYGEVLTIDKDGVVTALRAGEYYVMAEYLDDDGYFHSKLFPVTIIDDGSTRKGKKQFNPTDECEWRDMQYTLTGDGKFIAEGVYGFSGAQPNYLNYTVTDQCIFLDFVINDEDSSKMFYYQPFYLEIEECYAPEYRIYLNNRLYIVESQGTVSSKTIARKTLSTAQEQDKTDAYYYNDSSVVSLVEIPDQLYIKKSDEVIHDYIKTLLESKIDNNFKIGWIDDDICKVIVGSDVITNNVIDSLLKNDAVLVASQVYVPKDDYDLYINNGCPESMEVSQLNSVIYRHQDNSDQLLIKSLTNVNPASANEVDKVYYNLSGHRVESPSGLTIVVTRHSDGRVSAEKKLFLPN